MMSRMALNRRHIARAMEDIKAMGRTPNTDVDESRREISRIIKWMDQHKQHLELQRTACHALSNIGMHLGAARCVVEKGGFQRIQDALEAFPDDSRLCWLATSAIWNLARSPYNRTVIGAAGTKAMMRVLFRHRNEERVANTAMGALSNLSLDADLKDLVAQDENLSMILAVLVQYVVLKSVRVMTSAAGLLANLAVNDDHAATLIQRNALSIVLQLLSWKVAGEQVILYRNSCAALKNMCSADGFLESLLKVRGVEQLYDFLDHNDSVLHRTLCIDVLNMHEADGSKRTTSFHLAAHHGRIDILKHLIAASPEFDLDECDDDKMTSLDYCIAQGHTDIVQFLSRCGAVARRTAGEDPVPEDVSDAIANGQRELAIARAENQHATREGLASFPEHLCDYILEWNSTIDMLKGVNMFT